MNEPNTKQPNSLQSGSLQSGRQQPEQKGPELSSVDPSQFPSLKFDERDLITAIAQDWLTGEIRMVAYMNPEALRLTLDTGRATFFSRSRNSLWVKGETSGHMLKVHSVLSDCDGDALLLLVDPVGPSCHTGRPSCFFTEVSSAGPKPAAQVRLPFIHRLEGVISDRQNSTADKSYTRALLDAGSDKINSKLREEVGELCAAIENEIDRRVASEAADLLFHAMVGLRYRGVSLRTVIEVLASRFGVSGHEEKSKRASEPKPSQAKSGE